jgi:hypothetical protein
MLPVAAVYDLQLKNQNQLIIKRARLKKKKVKKRFKLVRCGKMS